MTQLSALAAAIAAAGPDRLDPLPPADELAALPAPDRTALIVPLRPELYAIAAILAEGTMRRADRGRPLFPPYGLARSMFSDLRMVSASPRPFEEASITSYRDLGRALVDTMVFHLDAELRSEQMWLTSRLEYLLYLFRVGADPARQARIRDGFSFLYGGLHFGVSVCVQMVEVMSRVLDDRASADVIARSIRAVLQLTALDVDQVAAVYQQLESPTGWLAAEHFVVHAPSGRPERIDLRSGAVAVTGSAVLGCPARVSLSGAPSAIVGLWRWSVELAEATGLLSTSGSPGTSR